MQNSASSDHDMPTTKGEQAQAIATLFSWTSMIMLN